jgi:hypothetical protein
MVREEVTPAVAEKYGFTITGGPTGKFVEVEKLPDEKPLLKRYYVENAGKYNLYTGTWPPAEGTILYEVITSLTIEPSTGEEITGTYTVAATNTIYDLDSNPINSTNPAYSTSCLVPFPRKINITENLPEHIFILNDKDPAELYITLAHDDGVEYVWKSTVDYSKKILGFDSFDTTPATANGNKCPTKEAGWFAVKPTANYNRRNETISSDVVNEHICKVTKKPDAPILTSLAYTPVGGAEVTVEVENNAPKEPVVIDRELGDKVTLKIGVDL